VAYNGILQCVINKTTKKVKRFGFCDFWNDGKFDSGTEEIVEQNFIFNSLPLAYQDWYWNGSTYQQGAV
jgi:hypothetical protein